MIRILLAVVDDNLEGGNNVRGTYEGLQDRGSESVREAADSLTQGIHELYILYTPHSLKEQR